MGARGIHERAGELLVSRTRHFARLEEQHRSVSKIEEPPIRRSQNALRLSERVTARGGHAAYRSNRHMSRGQCNRAPSAANGGSGEVFHSLAQRRKPMRYGPFRELVLSRHAHSNRGRRNYSSAFCWKWEPLIACKQREFRATGSHYLDQLCAPTVKEIGPPREMALGRLLEFYMKTFEILTTSPLLDVGSDCERLKAAMG